MIPSPLLVVTDRHGSARPLVDTVRAVLDGGARWIWFRDKDLESAARRDLALELLDLVHSAGGWLTIGSDAVLADDIGADGVHLGMKHLDLLAKQAEELRDRPATPASASQGEAEARQGQRADVGVSAHSFGDVRRAARACVGYVTLSPIFSSESKPGYGPALGFDALRDAAAIGLPVIALGGIAPEHAVSCHEAGAAGIAVMGALMRAPDPAWETRRFLQALQPLT